VYRRFNIVQESDDWYLYSLFVLARVVNHGLDRVGARLHMWTHMDVTSTTERRVATLPLPSHVLAALSSEGYQNVSDLQNITAEQLAVGSC
jgi:hypothetical protein